MASTFVEVTEAQGQPVSREQIERLCQRYQWAALFARGKDVLEVACGAGIGLALLADVAQSVIAGDISDPLLERAKDASAGRVPLRRFEGEELPFEDATFDRVLLFEAIYYMNAPRFFAEAHRVLRPGGKLLLVTANKDLFDFNPSSLATRYLGVAELGSELRAAGFEPRFLGAYPIDRAGMRQRLFRPIKYIAAHLSLIPNTMRGKEWVRRLVFGPLTPMPADIRDQPVAPVPVSIPADRPDKQHKVVYCIAERHREAV